MQTIPPPCIRPAHNRWLGLLAWTVVPVATFAGLGKVVLWALDSLTGHLSAAQPALLPALGFLIAQVASLALVLWLTTTTIGLDQAGVGPWPHPRARPGSPWWIRAPLLLSLLLLGVNVAAHVRGRSLAATDPTLAPAPLLVLLLLLVVSVAVGAFTEELLFRGYVLGRLTAVWGSDRRGGYLAAATSSLLFGAAHLGHRGPAGQLALTVGVTTLFGWLWAGMRQCSGSIWPGVVVHTAWNLPASLDLVSTPTSPSPHLSAVDVGLLAALAFLLLRYGSKLLDVALRGRARDDAAVTP